MPLTPPAAVNFKKQSGHLSVSQDKKYLFFTSSSPPGSSPAVTVPVADVTNLQQTPESSAKVALKVFVGNDNYVFSFTSKENARKEQENITETLRNIIAASKAHSSATLVASAASTSTPTARDGGDGGQSAAMAIAKAISSKAADEGWYDDNKLKSDIQLQRALLDSNKALKDLFNQALHERPESVSASQFTTQFWSARLHLLRAHAIDKAQKQGEYNVLPEIRFTLKVAEKEGDADIRQLQITKEQIKLIFKQYPVVAEAYNENVPPLEAGQFWQKFFGSRLLKKLKGEKITQHDPPDGILDKYLERREGETASHVQIPHFMDLEGNEQNHSQRKGNRPDQDMRPSSVEKVPILKVLNNLSEKMLSHVAPEDIEAHAPIGMDEGTFEQLRLRDLAMDDADNRVVLNVREQQRYVGGEDEDLSKEARLYAKQDPSKVLAGMRSDLRPSHLGSGPQGTLKLDTVIGFQSEDDDSDSEDDEPSRQTNGATKSSKQKRPMHVGSHAAMNNATTSVMSSITQRRTASATDPHSLNGLSQSTFDQLVITHSTTTEFLHYFWTLFLSGDSGRSTELAQLVSTLDRSLDRINAVASKAEDERNQKIQELKKDDEQYHRRTGKRRRRDWEAYPGGGKAVVEAMVRPTVQALGQATEVYRRAFEEQTREAAAAAREDHVRD